MTSLSFPHYNDDDDDNDDTLWIVSSRGYNDITVNIEKLRALASRKPTPLRLADMYKYAVNTSDKAQRLRNAQFLHQELAIRAAQRAYDLLTLRYGLGESEPIREVAHIYLRYVSQLESFPSPRTELEEEAFTDMLQSMVLDRTTIPMLLSRGIQEWRETQPQDGATASFVTQEQARNLEEIEEGLYRFFLARVGLRFLIEHHVLSSPRYSNSSEIRHAKFGGPQDFLGCIQTECDAKSEVERVAAKVKGETREHYAGLCPDIEIVECGPSGLSVQPEDNQNGNKGFTYVPHHLQYMIAELLKNSCRATVKR